MSRTDKARAATFTRLIKEKAAELRWELPDLQRAVSQVYPTATLRREAFLSESNIRDWWEGGQRGRPPRDSMVEALAGVMKADLAMWRAQVFPQEKSASDPRFRTREAVLREQDLLGPGDRVVLVSSSQEFLEGSRKDVQRTVLARVNAGVLYFYFTRPAGSLWHFGG